MVNQTYTVIQPLDAIAQRVTIGTREDPVDEAVARMAIQKLRARGYDGLRSVTCEHREGMLVLRGCVSSYFLKQLAQEIAYTIPGLRIIVNSVSVEGSNPLVQHSRASD